MSDELSGSPQKPFELEKLPSEVVGQILSFKGLSVATLRLWKSGSSAMRQHIRRSVSAISLEAPIPLTFAKLPLMLTELTSLRSFSVDRRRCELLGAQHTVKVLKSLSPTLEKLVLECRGAASLCEPDPELREINLFEIVDGDDSKPPIPVEDRYVDLAARFPRLQTLVLSTTSNFFSPQVLPASLTSLTCQLRVPKTTESVVFPSSLTHMALKAVNKFPQAFWDALPSGLEILDLSDARSGIRLPLEHVQKLPASLKKLRMNNRVIWDPSLEQLNALPPRLESLANVINSACPNLSQAFPSLKEVLPSGRSEVALTPSQLRETSRSLVSFALGLAAPQELAEGDFPPSLTYLQLHIDGPKPFEKIGRFLPTAHLTTLHLLSLRMSPALINQLPHCLTDLRLTSFGKMEGTGTINFPPSLVTLKLIVYNAHDAPATSIGKIPDTVKTLKLELHINVSSLPMLPSRLGKVRFGHLSGMDSFDPKDPAIVERITYLRKVAQEDGFVLKSLSPPREYGVFDLLPRTLTKMDIGGETELDKLDAVVWQSMPENLQKLLVWRDVQPLHPNTLDYLPMESITRHLRLPRVTWKDEHIKRLNPNLLEFDCQPGCTWLLTPASIPWVPLGITGNVWGKDDDWHEVLQQLTDERLDVLDTEDRQAFEAITKRPSN